MAEPYLLSRIKQLYGTIQPAERKLREHKRSLQQCAYKWTQESGPDACVVLEKEVGSSHHYWAGLVSAEEHEQRNGAAIAERNMEALFKKVDELSSLCRRLKETK